MTHDSRQRRQAKGLASRMRALLAGGSLALLSWMHAPLWADDGGLTLPPVVESTAGATPVAVSGVEVSAPAAELAPPPMPVEGTADCCPTGCPPGSKKCGPLGARSDCPGAPGYDPNRPTPGAVGSTDFIPATDRAEGDPLADRRLAGPTPPEDRVPGWLGRLPTLPGDASGAHFVPTETRWTIGLPLWDRYAYGTPINPYFQSQIKGDYPIFGSENLFFGFTGVSDSFFETRRVPVKQVNPAVAAQDAQNVFKQTFLMTFDLFQGDNTFHPSEWFMRITPAYQLTAQTDKEASDDLTVQEGFLDLQLAITSDFYDQTNLRIGRQGFVSDFRAFVFADVNDAIRLFGNAEANRTQWNLFFFDTVKKDAVSAFNTFDDREQVILGANIIRQDWVFDGLNALAGVTYDHDDVKQTVNAVWLELAVDGHIDRFLVSAALIQVLGHDELNPIAGREVDICSQFAALELAYQVDWFFPKVSVMWASGDADPTDDTGRGFDSIFENPIFAGAGFSYLQREALAPGGVTLINAFSFLPNLRTKANDPSNAVNPGLLLLNTGFNANLTSRLAAQGNLNYYQLMHTDTVNRRAGQVNAGQAFDIGKDLGVELNLGIVYKPLIIDNFIITFGASTLFPGDAIKNLSGNVDTQYTVFTAFTATY